MRGNPMILVRVIYLICQEQIEKLSVDPKAFGKSLPTPPDVMLDAIRDAIIDFFPSGRASHVREVLAKHEELSHKTDQLIISQTTQLMNDPRTSERLGKRASLEIQMMMDKQFPLNSAPGM